MYTYIQPVPPEKDFVKHFPKFKANACRSLLPCSSEKRHTSFRFKFWKDLWKCHWRGDWLYTYSYIHAYVYLK